MLKKLIAIFILITGITFLFQEKSEAILWNITPIGEPIVTENEITQKYNFELLELGYWQLLLKSSSQNWININDVSAIIPLANTDIITNTGSYKISDQSKTKIFEGNSFYQTNLEFSIKVNNIRGLKNGIYNLPLVFSTGDGSIYNYTANIFIPTSINITGNIPISNINLTENDVFNINSEIKNEVDTQINIRSNSQWNLYLDTTNIGKLEGDYYFQVISSSNNNINIPITSKTQLKAGQEYLIASGNKTYTQNIPTSYIPTDIKIRYYLRNNTQKYFQEGNFTNYLNYRIEEK